MKRPILKTKRFARTSKKSAPNPTKAAWLEAEFSPIVQASWDAVGKAVLDWLATDNRKRLRVDPTGKHNEFLARMMGMMIFGKPTQTDREMFGEFILTGIAELSPDELETEFAAIIAMKREAEKVKTGTLRKGAQWEGLLVEFVKQKGRRIECKGEFSAFVKRQGCPMPASDSGKTPIWKLLGIDHLPQKTRRK